MIIETETVKVKQATQRGYVECVIGGGSGLIVPRLKNPQRKGNRERRDLSHSDDGEYP